MPNAEQVERWDGPVGEHWVEHAERYSRMVAPFLDAIVSAAKPEPGEHGPFSLADESVIRTLLSEAGFGEISLDAMEAQMLLGPSVENVATFMRQHELGEVLFGDVSEAAADEAVASIARALAPHARADGVYLSGKAWIVSASLV